MLLAVVLAVSALHSPVANVGAHMSQPTQFRSSLRVAEPGTQQGPDGLTFMLTLAWAARPTADSYRTFMWTDAVGGWYRVTEGTSTTTAVGAFRSGCTAFIVIALPATPSSRNSMVGLDTTNVIRFPLSARPELCPTVARGVLK